jgi:hypothetical protein
MDQKLRVWRRDTRLESAKHHGDSHKAAGRHVRVAMKHKKLTGYRELARLVGSLGTTRDSILR